MAANKFVDIQFSFFGFFVVDVRMFRHSHRRFLNLIAYRHLTVSPCLSMSADHFSAHIFFYIRTIHRLNSFASVKNKRSVIIVSQRMDLIVISLIFLHELLLSECLVSLLLFIVSILLRATIITTA